MAGIPSDAPGRRHQRDHGAHALHGTATRLDFPTLEKLCRYFNCTVCDILAYTPGPPADGAGSG